MEALLKYWPLVAGLMGMIVNIIILIVKIDRHSASLGGKIDLINNTMEKHIGLRINNLEQEQEKQGTKIVGIEMKVMDIDKRVYAHLASHKS